MNPLMQLGGVSPGGYLGMMYPVMIFFIAFIAVIILISYIYTSFAMMRTAQRLKTEPALLAWVPIANNYLLSRMAKMHWWPILLLLAMIIPIINILAMVAFAVFFYIWLWKICEARGKPGWWALLTLIPVFGIIWYLIMFGILAWGKD